MAQEPTLQTISVSIEKLTSLILEHKKDSDLKFAKIDQQFNYIDEKSEGFTEIMLRNFDRLEKKIDDVRIELKEDIKAVFRTSILLTQN